MSQVFLFIGGSEIIVILLIVVMLFGADKIPEIARGLGKGLQEVKNASNEIKREINSQSGGVVGMAKDIKENVDAGKRNLTDIKGSVSREMYKTFAEDETTTPSVNPEQKAPETESPKKED